MVKIGRHLRRIIDLDEIISRFLRIVLDKLHLRLGYF